MRALQMTTRVVVALALLLGLPTTIGAQAHPCDAVTPTSIPVVASPLTVGFCHTGLDTAGNATTLTQFTVTIGTFPSVSEALTPQSGPNSAGSRYYQFSPISVTVPGTYPVTVRASNITGQSVASTSTSVCVACSFTITVSPIQ